jgi:hypothetical protein
VYVRITQVTHLHGTAYAAQTRQRAAFQLTVKPNQRHTLMATSPPPTPLITPRYTCERHDVPQSAVKLELSPEDRVMLHAVDAGSRISTLPGTWPRLAAATGSSEIWANTAFTGRPQACSMTSRAASVGKGGTRSCMCHSVFNSCGAQAIALAHEKTSTR